MSSILQTIWRSDVFRFIVCPLLTWLVAGLFLYGFVGPRSWRRQGQEYADPGTPDALTPFQVFIVIMEIAIPVGFVIVWLLLGH